MKMKSKMTERNLTVHAVGDTHTWEGRGTTVTLAHSHLNVYLWSDVLGSVLLGQW